MGIFGAEPWSEELRGEIERRLGIAAVNIYGLAEIVGPGVSAECIEGRNGSHIQEDHFLPEIVDPETGEPLPPGQEGELVLTPVTKEALPLIRYRTGDISSLELTPCVCGRTTVRMSRVKGRYDDMLIIRGVNLYPSEVERILLGVGDLAPHYQLVVDRPGTLDELSLLCEPAREGLDRGLLQSRLQQALHEQTGLSIAVQVLERDGCPAARARRSGWWTGGRPDAQAPSGGVGRSAHCGAQVDQELIEVGDPQEATPRILQVHDDVERDREDRGKADDVQPAAGFALSHAVARQQRTDQRHRAQQSEDDARRMHPGGREAGGRDVDHLVEGG